MLKYQYKVIYLYFNYINMSETKTKLSAFEVKVRRAEASKVCKRKVAAKRQGITYDEYLVKLEDKKKSPEEIKQIRNRQSKESRLRTKNKKNQTIA